MKKSMINTEHIEGRVYDHSLEVKTVKDQSSANFGKEFIAGQLEIATDDNGLNVIPVHFTYVTEFTASNKKNYTYAVLKQIIDDKKTILNVGPEEAFKVKIDTALAVNDFFSARDNVMVSTKQNEGGFVSLVNDLCRPEERNTFSVDMVITNVKRVEADPEKSITNDYVTVSGAVFNFRNELQPVEFKVTSDGGMNYFEGIGVSPAEPVFTKVWGKICSTTQTVTKTEESSFGEPAVKTYTKKIKDWIITGASKDPYDFGSEDFLTKEELKKVMQDREVHLADVRKRSEEYQKNKESNKTTAPTPAPVANGDFVF